MIAVLLLTLAAISYSPRWQNMRTSKNVEDCRGVREIPIKGTLARCPMWRRK